MTDTFRALCAEVLAFNNGESPYNFSGLNPYDRDNAAFDAWQDIRQRLKSALRRAQPEPEGPTDEEILNLVLEHNISYSLIDGSVMRSDALLFARAVLSRWGRPEPEGSTDEGLIQRLLSLAEQAVKEALDFEFEDPEDRYIWRELQELKQLVKEANGKA